jgi:hypothetical protein
LLALIGFGLSMKWQPSSPTQRISTARPFRMNSLHSQ